MQSTRSELGGIGILSRRSGLEGKESGETALLRTLLDSLRSQDVVVADSYYC